jgi:acyl dehydratase
MSRIATPRDEIEALAARRGQVLGRARPFRVSQLEEDVFAALIGDTDPMHNDPSWKFDQDWGGTIVLGFHVLARVENFLRQCGVRAYTDEKATFLTLGLGQVRFASPLPVGKEVTPEVTLESVEPGEDAVILRTTHRTYIEGSERPTMVAEHIGASFFNTPRFAGVLDSHVGMTISEIPSGSPIAPTDAHDETFYEEVAQRAGEWLGCTPWTTVEQRDADAFAVVSTGHEPLYNQPEWARRFGKFGQPIVRPLQLLALRAYFMPPVGLPVLSDQHMAAFNYGLDGVRWYASVEPGTPIRDHVQLLSVRTKDPGRYLISTRHVLEAAGQGNAVMEAVSLSLFAVRH